MSLAFLLSPTSPLLAAFRHSMASTLLANRRVPLVAGVAEEEIKAGEVREVEKVFAPAMLAAKVVATVPEVVTSPVKSAFVSEVAPDHFAKLPEAGAPVGVSVPLLVPHAPPAEVSNPPVVA